MFALASSKKRPIVTLFNKKKYVLLQLARDSALNVSRIDTTEIAGINIVIEIRRSAVREMQKQPLES